MNILNVGHSPCQQIRVNQVESLGIGQPQTVPYVCGGPATRAYVHPSGATEWVCEHCGQAKDDARDAERIRGWAAAVEQWARDVHHRPELAHWIEQVAASFHQVARNLDPAETDQP